MRKKNYRIIRITALVLAALTAASCARSSQDAFVDGTAASSAPELLESSGEETAPETSGEETIAETLEDASGDISQEAGITLSRASGIYPEEFELEMTCGEGEIYYTTDGSDPADSDTAVIYTEPLKITSREGDENVVSAVDPVLISGNFNRPNSSRDGFICEISAPEDDAVDKCTVIRAAIKMEDGSFAGETAATYFIGTAQEHIQGIAESCEAAGTTLAVISISMDYDDLFDSQRGIYVKGEIFEEALEEYLQEEKRVTDGETARDLDANYKQRGREWEREATITVFEFSEEEAVPVLTQDCGIRVQGNYSRSDLQKGFRLYARRDYGDNNFRYPFFGEDYVNDNGEVMDKFKTLVLRAGGNCTFTSKFNDTFWQSFLEDTACEAKQSRPCVVYLNGEYWGLYVLEEDYSDDYFEDIHGVGEEDVVV